MKFDELAGKCGEWLKGTGPESDIVISSRVRLARNLSEYPFVRRCSEADKRAILRQARQTVEGSNGWKDVEFVDVEPLRELDRQFLVERQLISRELSEAEGPRGVVVDCSERFSVMINEEDHLRIQVIRSGFDLGSAWRDAAAIDDRWEQKLTFAYLEQLGYLTACPTNVGTGLRVSVMLHLPALVITRQIDKVFRSLQKMNVAVRGLFGEGSQFTGDFYQVSNQITLGKSEEDLLKQVEQVVPQLIEYERKARHWLLTNSNHDLLDDVSRAYGILKTAKKISSDETMLYLSKVRMGVNLGLISDLEIPTVNKLFIHTQPAHLQKLRGKVLNRVDRNIERAVYLQKHLTN